MEEKKHEPVKHELHVAHEPALPQSKMDKKVVVAVIVLAFLLVFSVVQTIQLVNMKSQLQNEVDIGSAPLAGKKAASTQSGNLKTNIQNLPGMVGGC